MREEKNLLSRQSSFCYEHSYIYSNMYPSKDEYSVRFKYCSTNVMCKESRQKSRGNGLNM